MLFGVKNSAAQRTSFSAPLIAVALVLGAFQGSLESAPAISDTAPDTTETLKIEVGELSTVLRDNSQSPRILSGLDSLFNVRAAPDFDAFDPDSLGASAGLNFEHVTLRCLR